MNNFLNSNQFTKIKTIFIQVVSQEMVGGRKKSGSKPLQPSTTTNTTGSRSRRGKKVQVVQGSGGCVVYRLKEEEILQDLIAIRKSVAAKKRQNNCECLIKINVVKCK